MAQEVRSMSWKKLITIPAFMGLVLGFIAALIQALLISAGGPEAYGFCVACHTRDMALWFTNLFVEPNIAGVAGISAFITAFTPLGVIIGGYYSARKNKEFKIKKSKPLTYLLYTLGGIAVMNFALFLGACPYRAALRVGYGDWVALIGILGIIAGVAVGALIILRRMKREVL